MACLSLISHRLSSRPRSFQKTYPCKPAGGPHPHLSLGGFSSSRLLSRMSLGLGVLLFASRKARRPRFRHEAAHYQPITPDQLADDGEDATGKTTQHA